MAFLFWREKATDESNFPNDDSVSPTLALRHKEEKKTITAVNDGI